MDLPETIRKLKELYEERVRRGERPPRCISCGHGWVWKDGTATRSLSVLFEGEVVHVPEVRCVRGKCSRCKHRWVEHPPGVLPHKHYQPCVVEHAVATFLVGKGVTQTKVARRCGCSRRTVGRWLRWVAQVAQPEALARKVREAVEAVEVPWMKPVREVVEQGRKGTDAVFDVLRRGAEVLGWMEELARAWNLESPGLRAVLRRVIGDRSGVATYARPLIPELARGLPA